LTHLEHVLLRGISTPPLVSESTPVTIIETGLGSVPPVSTLAMDILEELTLQMNKQFFTMMKYYTELVLTGRSFFEFAPSLLKNQIKNIRQIEGSDRAKAYQVLGEQLRMYLKNPRNLESTNLVDDAQHSLSDLHAAQERDRKEVEEQIAEQACHLVDSKASYQNLTNNLQICKIVEHNAEGVIVSAQASIAKPQTLIQDNEQKHVNENKRVEELEAAKNRVQQELNV